jgi:hypothetical protein
MKNIIIAIIIILVIGLLWYKWPAMAKFMNNPAHGYNGSSLDVNWASLAPSSLIAGDCACNIKFAAADIPKDNVVTETMCCRLNEGYEPNFNKPLLNVDLSKLPWARSEGMRAVYGEVDGADLQRLLFTGQQIGQY